jgi:uncharacterized protein (UPF0332 family)
MTAEPFPEYAQKELQLAGEALDDSEYLWRNGRLNAATNRAYYAMFHAAQAALASDGMRRPRTHRGTINLFGHHWVRAGKIDRAYARDLQDAFDMRLKSDYDIYAVTDSDLVKETIDKAGTFVAEVKRLVNEV